MGDFTGKFGVVLLAIGVSIADSDNILIPAVLAILGCLMILFTNKEGCDE